MTITTATDVVGHRSRVPLWDNARYLTVTLVVIGHGIFKLIDEDDASYGVYLFIYAFHVPVFVVVSGYFAQAEPPGAKQLRRVVADFVLPYLVFETVWTLIHWAMTGRLNLDLAKPSWTLWFLLALIVWRVMLPYLAQLRYPLLISLAISLWAGYFEAVSSEFALSRALGLLPFFVLGWRLRHSDLTRHWTSWGAGKVALARAVSVALFFVVGTVIAFNIDFCRQIKIRRFLLFDESYPTIGYDEWWAGGIRFAVIVVAALLALAFLSLVPRRQTFFTSLGRATMYIYLLHSFVLYPFREVGVLERGAAGWYLPGMIAVGIVASYLLGQRPVHRLFRPLIEPRPRWLLRPASARIDHARARS